MNLTFLNSGLYECSGCSKINYFEMVSVLFGVHAQHFKKYVDLLCLLKYILYGYYAVCKKFYSNQPN